MKIVLLHFEMESWYFWGDVLGPEYLAAELRVKGNEVHILRVPIYKDKYTDDAFIDKIIAFRPGMIGFSLPCPFQERLSILGEEFEKKVPEIHITCGNRYASDNSEYLLNRYSWLDSVVRGEGEHTIVEMAYRLEKGINLNGCRGVYFKEGGRVVKNPERELIKDLNSIQVPARDDLLELSKEKNATFLTGRGCVNNCTFCNSSYTNNQKGKVWRGRDPENVVNELEYVSKQLGYKNFFFADPSYEEPGKLGKARIKNIAEDIIKRGLEINYGVYFSAHRWSREDLPLLTLLKKSGLEYIYVGIEAGTPESLNVLNKRATVEDNYRMLSLVRKAGLGVKFGFIMFHPYLTMDELKRSLDFVYQARIGYSFRCFYNELEVYKGTEMFNMLERDGHLTGAMDSEIGNYFWKFKDKKVALVRDLTREILNENSCIQKEIELEYKVISFINRVKNRALRHQMHIDATLEFESRIDKIYMTMNDLNYNLLSQIIDLADREYKSAEYRGCVTDYINQMQQLVKDLENKILLFSFKAKKMNLL